MKNIHGSIAFLLKGFTIRTFDKLLNKATSLDTKESHMKAFRDRSQIDLKQSQKVFDKRPNGSVLAMDKGKKPMSDNKEQKGQQPSRQS